MTLNSILAVKINNETPVGEVKTDPDRWTINYQSPDYSEQSIKILKAESTQKYTSDALLLAKIKKSGVLVDQYI